MADHPFVRLQELTAQAINIDEAIAKALRVRQSGSIFTVFGFMPPRHTDICVDVFKEVGARHLDAMVAETLAILQERRNAVLLLIKTQAEVCYRTPALTKLPDDDVPF